MLMTQSINHFRSIKSDLLPHSRGHPLSKLGQIAGTQLDNSHRYILQSSRFNLFPKPIDNMACFN